MAERAVGIDVDGELAVLNIETAVGDLDGIEAVRVVPGSNRPIDELHVIVTPDRDPKQTVRDIHSLLRAGFDLEVDRRVISVVQLPSDAGKRLRDGIPRLVLDTVQIEVRNNETSVTVVLADGDDTIRGCAGPIGDERPIQAAAEATLDALADRLEATRFRLLGADLAQVGTELVAVAAVHATRGRTTELLTGSAVVRHSEPDAVVRAVLDATNRLHRN